MLTTVLVLPDNAKVFFRPIRGILVRFAGLMPKGLVASR